VLVMVGVFVCVLVEVGVEGDVEVGNGVYVFAGVLVG
jgi:hypothetical protein